MKILEFCLFWGSRKKNNSTKMCDQNGLFVLPFQWVRDYTNGSYIHLRYHHSTIVWPNSWTISLLVSKFWEFVEILWNFLRTPRILKFENLRIIPKKFWKLKNSFLNSISEVFRIRQNSQIWLQNFSESLKWTWKVFRILKMNWRSFQNF